MKTSFFTKFSFTALLLALCVGLFAQDRSKDPVVVPGSVLSDFHAYAPNDLVGFKYTGSNWQQVPIQIDEMVLLDIAAPYGSGACTTPSNGSFPWTNLYYADPNTHVGPDTNPNLDNDDELVFMQFDTGQRFNGADCPAGVDAQSLLELTIQDPLNGNIEGYLYLFVQDGSLNQDAGQDYVNYSFILDNGGTLSGYPVCEDNTSCNGGLTNSGGQCESSIVTTSEYEVEFSARWLEDVLRIKTSGSSGIDVLDRHRALITNANCNRTTDSFSSGRGPIVASIDGPVRAIRSVMGANSGTFTQKTILFTKYRADYALDLRVHEFNAPCVSFVNAFDLSSSAFGMTYTNSNNTVGYAIDGSGDYIDEALPDWILVDGPHGAIAATLEVDTNIPQGSFSSICVSGNSGQQVVRNYFNDGGGDLCNGNSVAYGMFGARLITDVCTDPRHFSGCNETLQYITGERAHYYLAPGTTNAEADTYSDYVRNPLTVNSQLYTTLCDGGTNDPLIVSTTTTPVSCAGGSDGSVSTSVSGGSGGYSYSWSNGQSTAQLINVAAGFYTVTVTDSNGATATATDVVTEPSALVLSLSGTNETNGNGNGSASSTINGGTPLYSYAWSGPGGFFSSLPSIQNLSAGTYILVVTDANGCTISDAIVIENIDGCDFTELTNDNFEAGWGNWNSGGSNSSRVYVNSAFGWAVRLRNGTSTSTTTSDPLNLAGYTEIKVNFTYSSYSMEYGEFFTLSLIGGGTTTQLGSWASGIDFTPGQIITETISYSGSLANNSVLVFQSFGNLNNDHIYLDNIVVEACGEGNDGGSLFGLNAINNGNTEGYKIERVQTSGIKDLQVFPNPTPGVLAVSFNLEKSSNNVMIQVLDIYSNVVFQQQRQLNAGFHQEKLLLDALPSGLYWLRIYTGEGEAMIQKVIKQ